MGTSRKYRKGGQVIRAHVMGTGYRTGEREHMRKDADTEDIGKAKR